MKKTIDELIFEFRGKLFQCHKLIGEIEERFGKYEEFARKIKENENNEL